MNIKNLFVISICISLFTGCSFKKAEQSVDISKSYKSDTKSSLDKKYEKFKIANNRHHDFNYSNYMSMKNDLNDGMYNFYTQWQGVKYQMGGDSKSGIDCSGFVQKMYKSSFNLDIPRNTSTLSGMGYEISKNELEIGDLVFFKTGKTNHVGIYLDNGKFMHASTKIGVTISDLNSDYYLNSYWKAQRVIY